MVNKFILKGSLTIYFLRIFFLSSLKCQITILPENNLEYDAVYRDDLQVDEKYRHVLYAAASLAYTDEYNGIYYQNTLDCRGPQAIAPADLHNLVETNLKVLYTQGCVQNNTYNFLRSGYTTESSTAIFETTFRLSNPDIEELQMKLVTCSSIDPNNTSCRGEIELDTAIVIPPNSIFKYIFRWTQDTVWSSTDDFATSRNVRLPQLFTYYFYTTNVLPTDPANVKRLFIHSMIMTVDLGTEIRALNSNIYNFCVNAGCAGSSQCNRVANHHSCFYVSNYIWHYSYQDCGNNGCIPGTYCSVNCLPCDEQCATCFDGTPMNCQSCYLTALDPYWKNTVVNTAGRDCPFEYISLTHFGPIKIDVPIPTTYRMTIEFWVFVHNTKDLTDSSLRPSVSSIILKDFFTISIMSSGMANTDIDISLFPYELFYSFPEDIISTPQLNTFIASNPDIQRVTATITDPSSKWVHIQAGLSYQHKEMFVNAQTQAIDPIVFLTGGNHYSSYIRKYYREGDKTSLRFQGFSYVNSLVYVRNVNVYSEYIPPSVSSKYFNLKGITNYEEIPQLLFSVPFDETHIVSNTLLGNAKFYDYSGQFTTTNTVSVSDVSFTWIGGSLKPPKNFRRLKLLAQNRQYSNTDLSSTAAITCNAPNSLCFDINIPYVCTPNNALVLNTVTCGTNCNNSMRLPVNKIDQNTNTKINRHFCGYECDTNVLNCPNINQSLETFTCKPDFTAIFFQCMNNALLPPSKSAIQFSSTLNTHSIEFDLPSLYDNFLIEMWFHPELLYQTDPPLSKKHILKTNAHELFYSPIEDSLMFKADIGGIVSDFVVTQKLYYYGWNHIILSNKPILSNTYTEFSLSILNSFQLIGSAVGLASMNKICFCNKDLCCGSTGTESLDMWVKELKIWDGSIVNSGTLIDYDKFSYVRPGGLLHFFPFQITNLNVNKIADEIDPTIVAKYPNQMNKLNPDQDMNYNYGWDFSWNDINNPRFATKTQITSSNKVEITQFENCYIGCDICFGVSKNSCFKCKPGYALSGSTCTLTSKNEGFYYYMNPLDAAPGQRLSLAVPNLSTHQSITFFCYLKVYGFTSSALTARNTDLIIFNNGQNFKLRYNPSNYQIELTLNGVTQFSDEKFIDSFGQWIPLSIAAFRSNDLTLQLHMNSMTVGSKPLKILVNPPQLFPFNEITFSDGMIGLISQITLFNQFIINALGYAQHYNSPTSIFNDPAIVIKHFPMRNTNSNLCVPVADIASPLPPTGLKCVEDYVAHIDQTCTDSQYVSLLGQYVPPRCIDNASKCDNIVQTIIAMTNCDYLYASCDNISRNSINNMPFSYTNSLRETYITCGNSNTLDVARYNPGTIPNVKSPNDVFKLEFWFLSQSYVGNNFGLFTVSWHRHIKITVSFTTGGKFHAHCYPLINNADSSLDGIGIGFDYAETTVTDNKWRYAVCGVDVAKNEYYITNLQKDNYAKGALGLSGTLIPSGTVDLLISETSNTNFGVTYIKELRLWNCYQCSSDRAFIPYNKDDVLFNDMIHYFKFEDTTGLIKDYGTDTINGDLTISTQLFQKAAFNGSGLLKKIPDPPNCNESGFSYFSLKKGEGCDILFNMNMLPDITFPKIPSSKNGRYTMDMWFYIESADDFTKGFNIIFNEHMAISSYALSKTDRDLTIYCFPQSYRDNLYDKSGAEILNAYNAAQNKLQDTYTNGYSKWNYLRCAYNYETKQTYINNQTPIGIIPEVLYSNPTSHSNASPFKFFPSFYNDLIINKVIDNFTRIFIQTINIYREYIPQSIPINRLSMKNYANANYYPLTFAVDFQNDYDIIQNRLKYYYTDPDYVPSSPAYLTRFLANSRPKTYLTYPLYDDFVLCSVGRTYNAVTNECDIITSPGSCDNKSTFCFDNDKYFYCKAGLYLDIDAHTCNSDCPSRYTRMPDIVNEIGMCQFPRSLFTQSPRLNNELKQGTYQNLFQCEPTNEVRVYYQCLSQSLIASSAIYFSNKYSFTNTIADYSSLKLKDYFVDFWFMFERIEQFRFNDNSQRRTIFIAYPHFITRLGNTIEYNNQFIPLTHYTINNLKQFEWNRIVIENYLIEEKAMVHPKKYINIYVNNNYITPSVQIESTKQNDFSLAQIAFCSHVNEGFSICNLGMDSFSYQVFNPTWEDAFYRDIIVWNRKGTNLSNINSYHSLYTELTSNIVSYHTMRLDTIKLKNIRSAINSPSVDLVARYNTMSDYDSGNSINFITGFDIGSPSSSITNIASNYIDNTIPMFSLTDTTYTITPCTHPCLRCFSPKADDCFSCVAGHVLSGTKCSIQTNFYFKTPTSNSAAQTTIDLNLDISTYEEVTITFYMKFLGSLQKGVSTIPILLFHNNDNYLGWNNDDNSFCLIYDTNKKAFNYDDSRQGIGKWTLFGIAISNERKNPLETKPTFPNMINFMVDQVIVPPIKEFGNIIMTQLIEFNKLSLSNQVSALFYNMKVFNKYYLGSYGIGQDHTSSALSSFQAQINFRSIANDNSCINTPDPIGTGYCFSDLNPFDDPAYNCPNPSTQYKILNPFDLTFTCTDCDTYCTNHCFDKGIDGCTCSIDSGTYWIRDDESYYCNKPDSLNIAEFSPIVINNIGIGTTKSYMIEVWVFILDYLSDKFEGLNISWDAFNRIEIVPKINKELLVRCYPYVEISNLGKWTENAEATIQKERWQFLRCKVDLNSKLIVMNEKEKELTTTTKPSPVTTSQLKIEDMNKSTYSYGVILVRELRLWNERNNLFYETDRLNLATDNTYKNLIHYYKNIFPVTEVKRNYMYDEIKKLKTTLTTTRTFNYYSYIKTYEKLVLCNEGQVYKLNPITNLFECSLYNSDDILDNLEGDTTLYTPNDLLTKAVMIYEMALKKYTIPPSSKIYSQVTLGADGNLTLTDPSTSNSYCSNKGYAKIIDRFLCCYCFVDNVGNYCQLPSEEYYSIDKIFTHFTKKAFQSYEKYKDDIDVDEIIRAFDYLITGSALFSIDNQFITDFVSKLNSIIYTINDCREDMMKVVDHLYTNVFLLTNYYKVGIITNSNTGSSRNAKLNYLQKDEISPSAITVKQFIEYLAGKCFSKLSSTNIHFNLKLDNFNLDLIRVKSGFDYEGFFSANKKAAYEPYFSLSSCLTTDANIMYINWYNNPYYYNEEIYWNYTSSYMTIKAYDLSLNQIAIQKCDDPITFYLTNLNPELVSIINDNKNNFKKENIHLPNDPIFTEPFFIEPNGKVNRTTVKERIDTYYFAYRFVFKSLDAKSITLTNEELYYEDIRIEDFYFICRSNHLSEFILTYDYNESPTQVDGRLYFLKHFNLFIYGPNYSQNYGFIAIMVIIGIYLLNLAVCCIKFSMKKKKTTLDQLFDITLSKYVFPYGNSEGEYFFKEDGKKIFKEDEVSDNDKKGKKCKNNNDTKVTAKEKDKEIIGTDKNDLPFEDIEAKPESNILSINKRILKKNEFENFFSKITSNNGDHGDIIKPTNETVYNQSVINNKISTRNNNNYMATKHSLNYNDDIDTIKLKEEYKHNLKIYNEDFRTRILQEMKINCCKFFWINFTNRNIVLSSFRENIIYTPGIKSLYLPMYLALVLFFNSLIYLFQYQMSYTLIYSSQLLEFIGFSLAVIVSVNVYFYIKSLLYNISQSAMRDLLFKSKANKSEFITAFSRHTRRFKIYLVIEIILFIALTFFTFLLSFGLSAIYTDQARCMISSSVCGIVADFILSFIIELLVASCYTCRKNNGVVVILNHVNRLKSNKVISP